LPLRGIEPHFDGRPARNLITVVTELPRTKSNPINLILFIACIMIMIIYMYYQMHRKYEQVDILMYKIKNELAVMVVMLLTYPWLEIH
jgi:hypothetical protein